MKVTYPNHVISDLVRQLKITRLEAKRRYYLLCASGIEQDQPDLQNRLLSAPSEESMPLVVLEICVNRSMETESLVKEYDRLTKSNLANILRLMELGIEAPNARKEVEAFGKFVEETIYSRIDPATYITFFDGYPNV